MARKTPNGGDPDVRLIFGVDRPGTVNAVIKDFESVFEEIEKQGKLKKLNIFGAEGTQSFGVIAGQLGQVVAELQKISILVEEIGKKDFSANFSYSLTKATKDAEKTAQQNLVLLETYKQVRKYIEENGEAAFLRNSSRAAGGASFDIFTNVLALPSYDEIKDALETGLDKNGIKAFRDAMTNFAKTVKGTDLWGDVIKEMNAQLKSAVTNGTSGNAAEDVFSQALDAATKQSAPTTAQVNQTVAASYEDIKNAVLSALQAIREEEKAEKEATAAAREAAKQKREAAKAEKEKAATEEKSREKAEADAEKAANKAAAIVEKLSGVRDKLAGLDSSFLSGSGRGELERTIASVDNLIGAVKKGTATEQDAATVIENSSEQYSRFTDEINANKRAIDASGAAFKNLWANIKRVLGITSIIALVRRMTNEVVELDNELTQLQIVTKASATQIEQHFKGAADGARNYGLVIKDVINATTTYARLGYSLQESETLAQYTAMLQNVGDVDADSAQKAITAIVAAFDINAAKASEIELVMDKLVRAGNNFPISVSEISEAITDAAAPLRGAGNTLSQSIAILIGANATLQDASKSATAVRTLTARLRNTTADLQDLGETDLKYEELVNVLTSGGVALKDVNGNYRSTYEILRDIAKVWPTLEDGARAAIETAIAGTRQQAAFESIMQNFDTVEEALYEMESSAGTLSSSYDTYMDSISAHMNALKSSVSELYATIIDSDTAIDIIDLLTGATELLTQIADLVDKNGGIYSILTIIAGINFAKIADAIDGIAQATKTAGASGFFNNLFGKGSDDLKSGIIGKLFGTAATGAGVAGAAEAAGTVATGAGSAGTAAAAAGASLGGVIAVLLVAIPIVLGLFEKIKTVAKDLQDQSNQAVSASYDGFVQNANAADVLLHKLNDTADGAKDYSSAAKEMNSAIKDINGTVGTEIDLLNENSGSLDDLKEKAVDSARAIKQANADAAKSTYQSNQKEYDKAVKKLEDIRRYQGLIGPLLNNSIVTNDAYNRQETQAVIEEFRKSGVIIDKYKDGLNQNVIFLEGSAADIVKAYEKISSSSESGWDKLTSNVQEQIEAAYNRAKERYDRFSTIYEKYIQLVKRFAPKLYESKYAAMFEEGPQEITDPDSPGDTGGGDSTLNLGGGVSSETWFSKELKLHQHLLAMEKEGEEDYLNWLSSAYKKAYADGSITLDEYYQHAEEVYSKLKSLFKDYLSDVEREISISQRYDKSSKKQVEYYQNLIDVINNEIQDAYKMGLDDNSDYVQELQDKAYDYSESIKEITKNLEEDAKDATEELVDFRINMLKKDIENQKNALKERLDDLKDFYDRQKRMLQDEYDAEEYLKEQSERRKAVAAIQAQIDALRYDDSAWAAKRRLELQEELLDAQTELDEFERDHALEVAQDKLDEMYEMQEKEINSEVDLLDQKYNDTKALRDQAIADISNGTAELYQQMIEWNQQYGSAIDEDITSKWEAAYKALEEYQALTDRPFKIGNTDIQLENATGYQWNIQSDNGKFVLKASPNGVATYGNLGQAPTSSGSGGGNNGGNGGSPQEQPTSNGSSALYSNGKKIREKAIFDDAPDVEFNSVTVNKMPSVIGMTFTSAKRELRDQYGLVAIANSETKYLENSPNAIVTHQNPSIGTSVMTGDYVVLTLSPVESIPPQMVSQHLAPYESLLSQYASGSPNTKPGLASFDEDGSEYIFKSGDGNSYRIFSSGEKVLNARAANFLYNFAERGSRIMSGLSSSPSASLAAIGGSGGGVVINSGDIIIQGDASEKTVSEIRRAQRNEIDFIMKSINKFNKN